MNGKPILLVLILTGTFVLSCVAVATLSVAAEQLSLAALPPRIHNRHASLFTEGTRAALRLDELPGDGLAWWPETRFSDGVIEFDVRGKNVFQRSFVGVAFHGQDEKTYDAVYFRPFNFRAADPARRNHAVQYVAMPAHDWQMLRTQHPEKYEKPVVPAPSPDEWFHVRVVVAHPSVSVFVNEASEPCLVVEQLSARKTGWIGLWVGNNSGGEFANLRIAPSK